MKKLLIYSIIVMTCFHAQSLAQIKKSASVWFQSGKEKASNKDYYGAVEEFTKALELNPGFAKAYYHRGIAYLKYNRKSKSHSNIYKEKARADFMKAKELGLLVGQKYLDECE
jgi:Flp pilus assembly protein TadD